MTKASDDKQTMKDEAAAERAYQHTQHDAPTTTGAEPTEPVAPGCSEPGQVPPSVVGTSQDPNKAKE